MAMEHKRQPPQVIFWPGETALWTWNAVPMHTRLMEVFRWVLNESAKRGHSTVTVLQFYRPRKQGKPSPHSTNPCEALDFSIGGMDGVNAGDFAQYVNRYWIHGGSPGPSGKPLRVLLYRDNDKGKHFHTTACDKTRQVKKSRQGG